MFFNPRDVKYFRPVELTTKFGLRGHIKDSLGTHGLMKCQFNDYIKQNDTVCMPLYKRKYPRWHDKAWREGGVEQWVTEAATEMADDDQVME
jgi:pre-rRNA-processing protein TSR1